MKIAMVSEHASPLATLGGADAGGQNVHVSELSAALARAGNDVTVYTRREDRHTPRDVKMPSGVRVVHVDAGPPRVVPKDDLLPFMAAFGAQLDAAFAIGSPDLVHAHFWMSGLAALAGARPHGIPVVQTFHALGSEKRRHQGHADTSPADRIALECQVAREADRIVATSSAEIFELCRMGADPRKLKIVPCGVNVEQFDRIGTRFEMRRSQRNRVVALCRLVERKGVADAIAALRDIPQTELLVAGGCEPEELALHPEAQRLTAIAINRGVADRVFLLGRIAREAVPGFLRSADVALSVPWYEPFGIMPLEAMACGVPLVASAVGGQNDTVIDRFTGLHVRARDPVAIAMSVRELIESPSLAARLAAAARERVLSRYTWDRVASETLKAYRELNRSSKVVSNTA